MSLYRCAACGSPNVVTGTEKDGFSYSKGIAGTIVFGLPGVVAGINGNTKCVYKCPDCGLTMDHTMAPEIKIMIDMGVMSESARNNLTLMGAKIDWSTLKNKYKNIELGHADAVEIAKLEKLKATSNNRFEFLKSIAKATQKEFDEAVDVLHQTQQNFWFHGKGIEVVYNNTKPIPLNDYIAWQNALKIFIENCYKYLPQYSFEKDESPYFTYREFEDNLEDLFDDYLKQQHFSKNGTALISSIAWGKKATEDNPIISAFLEAYGKRFYNFKIEYNKFVSKKTNKTEYFKLMHTNSDYRQTIKFKAKKEELNSLFGDSFVGQQFGIYIPSHLIINDKLYYNEYSYEYTQEGKYIGHDDSFINLVKSYFNKHPGEKDRFKALLKQYEKLVQQVAQYEREIEKLQNITKTAPAKIDDARRKVQQLKYDINDMKLQIAKLSKKIFGKAKAREQITELNSCIQEREKNINQLNSLIEKTKEEEEDTSILIQVNREVMNELKYKLTADITGQIIAEMNYFVDWKMVE